MDYNDERRTASDGPARRKLKLPIGTSYSEGTKSESNERRISKTGESGRKGVISSRTTAKASMLFESALNSPPDTSSDSHPSTNSATHSTRSSFSSSPDANVELSPPTFSRGQQVAVAMEVSSKLKLYKDNLPDNPPEVPDFSQFHTKGIAYTSKLGLDTTSKRRDIASVKIDAYPSPAQQAYQKLHPMSPSHTGDPLACESRDSEEENRMAEMAREMTSNTVNLTGVELLVSSQLRRPSLPSTNPTVELIILKCIMVGNPGVGKTSILKRHFDQRYEEKYHPSVGVDHRSKKTLIQGRDAKFQLWDTSGHKQSEAIMSTYYRGAHCFAIVYDVTDYDTVSLIPEWISLIKNIVHEQVPIILIGNKADKGADRVVAPDGMVQYAALCGLQGYAEVSAKSSVGLIEAMDLLTQHSFDRLTATGSTTTTPPPEEADDNSVVTNSSSIVKPSITDPKSLAARSFSSPPERRSSIITNQANNNTYTSNNNHHNAGNRFALQPENRKLSTNSLDSWATGSSVPTSPIGYKLAMQIQTQQQQQEQRQQQLHLFPAIETESTMTTITAAGIEEEAEVAKKPLDIPNSSKRVSSESKQQLEQQSSSSSSASPAASPIRDQARQELMSAHTSTSSNRSGTTDSSSVAQKKPLVSSSSSSATVVQATTPQRQAPPAQEGSCCTIS